MKNKNARWWLKGLRIGKGISQKEMADMLDITQVTYSYYETGKQNPPVKRAKQIAEILGFDWIQFYPMSEEDKKVI